MGEAKGGALLRPQRHIDHPGDKPIFLGKGKGNFEPDSYEPTATGPGEGGKAHRLRIEQKQEEEKQILVWYLLQMSGNPLRGCKKKKLCRQTLKTGKKVKIFPQPEVESSLCPFAAILRRADIL